jgi:predicted MFS family arabinose efflux permease
VFKAKERPRLALFLVTAIAVIGFVDRIVLNVLVQPLKAEFGFTDTQIGLLTGLAFAVLNVGLGLVVARMAERMRRINLIVIGTVFWSIATAACGLAGSAMQLALARISVGVGEAVGLPSTASVLSDYYPREKRGMVMSVYNLAPPIGAFLGASGGAMIAQIYGWRYAFFAAAVPGIILGVLLMLFIAEPKRGGQEGGTSDVVPPLSAVLARYWQWPTMRHMLAGSTIAGLVGFGLNGFLAAYMSRRFGFSLIEAGLVAGLVASLPAAISITGAGWLCDRMALRGNKRGYALIPGVMLLVSAPIYAFAITRDSAPLMIGLVAFCALIQYTYLGPTAGTFQNMLAPRMRASGYAFVGVIYSLVGTGLGPLTVGLFSDRYAASGIEPGVALGFAMATAAGLYAWAGIHYLVAARTIEADLSRPVD